MQSKIDLTDLIQLRAAAQTLPASQLVVTGEWVQGAIDERLATRQQTLQDRKIKEMRGLMSKAGISWDEFQDALK
jgi:hypothetical protein